MSIQTRNEVARVATAVKGSCPIYCIMLGSFSMKCPTIVGLHMLDIDLLLLSVFSKGK